VRTSKTGFLVLFLVLGMLPSAMAQSVGKVTKGKAKMVGTTTISGAPSANFSSTPTSRTKRFRDLVAARRGSMSTETASAAVALAKTLSVPAPTPNTVKSGGNSVGFPGLTTVDTANTNGFVLSPPDQGLCVGNGLVLEPINLVIAVYSKTGTQPRCL
jgi:hypothetical protein